MNLGGFAFIIIFSAIIVGIIAGLKDIERAKRRSKYSKKRKNSTGKYYSSKSSKYYNSKSNRNNHATNFNSANNDVLHKVREFERYYKQQKLKTSYYKNPNIKKGKDFELFVGKYLEQRGYKVEYHGITKGYFDLGIDLIGRRNDEIIFVQCKNWNENSQYKVSVKDIKKFIKGIKIYLENHPTDRIRYNYIKRIYAISGKILSKSAYRYIKENNHLINFWIIPYHNS